MRRLWLLALSEPLAKSNGDDSRGLASSMSDSRKLLQRDWNIQSRQELLDTLAWLKESGHRQSYAEQENTSEKEFSGWDYVRGAQLVRLGSESWLFTLQ